MNIYQFGEISAISEIKLSLTNIRIVEYLTVSSVALSATNNFNTDTAKTGSILTLLYENIVANHNFL